ncbi:hypothetical protein [Fulvivirga lutea]|uniref:Uncharacterized protein n=1 Tax=Fulvivirga lutea TaxID=2810512 RepID=A0A974WG84_9BACT|nr:hypothetical protein [Fulvivirga lutea]QSE96482.1 hypothetical protein JR347_12835 [Fulvivirga lutea]
MFDTHNFSKSLEEDVFDSWLEAGRNSKLGYEYMVVVWLTMEEEFKPIYLERRDQLSELTDISNLTEVVVAAYDLYSESKVTI